MNANIFILTFAMLFLTMEIVCHLIRKHSLHVKTDLESKRMCIKAKRTKSHGSTSVNSDETLSLFAGRSFLILQ